MKENTATSDEVLGKMLYLPDITIQAYKDGFCMSLVCVHSGAYSGIAFRSVSNRTTNASPLP